MKCIANAIPTTLAVLLGCVTCVRAELTTEQEALRVARNHVRLMVLQGRWATAGNPEVGAIQEFKRGQRVLGYFCPVKPMGFVVLSLHRELEPVKAFSATCDLDPTLEEGMPALLKDQMEGILDAVAAKLGRAVKPDDQFQPLLQINYRPAFDILAANDFDPGNYATAQGSVATAGMNYQEVGVLLTSRWHQLPPYNQQCPEMGCSWPDQGNANSKALVGCVATAGAQILRYWRWGPPEPFAWPNMCDVYRYDGAGWFNDENGNPVTGPQIDAVAGLCHIVGIYVGMDYGCDGSGAVTSDMEGVFEALGYNGAACVLDHSDYAPLDWYNVLKEQINVNRPVQYKVVGHSIVCDGWMEEWGGPNYYWYHMNYGWVNESWTVWYALDALLHGNPGEEQAITNIVPNNAIGGALAPEYPGLPGMWRYFDQDIWSGPNATFYPGQWLQILKSGFYLRSNGGPGQSVKFYGQPGLHTRFFLDGDASAKTRILVQDGCMKIHNGAGMVIR